ncbi:malto-oligosyltrehalose synthase [Spirulina major CS-329]|nr:MULTISPECIES: malto-oligosyltrehalose synthase [Spirulina]MDB9493464.1 malto-oligosyltrehalose synthase [Spirulina subsalsa CS-330]MDB9505213.1 malto-oligosyltrehalose synthase [Spirulina major CS-329]
MMHLPLATYRLQFNPQFTFKHAKAIVPYLAELGVSYLYASPIFKARSGSTHGYDVADPTQLNPELGGADHFEDLTAKLQEHQIKWLQDIVPNHMAFDSQNQMLMDVLENGSDSQYKNYFDIQWDHPYEGIRGKVLAPFLGKFYGDCLESGELQLQYDEQGFSVNYYDLKFPIRIESYTAVLAYNLGQLRQTLGRKHPDFVKFLGVLYGLKYIPSGEEGSERYDQIAFIKSMLWELWNDNTDIHTFIETNIQLFNGQVGIPESFNRLEELLSEQFFRLAFWKVGNEELNYRRFFTVNDLISLRIEDPDVFKSTHQLIFDLIEAGKIHGLRIDHIDGLFDPSTYLFRLRDRANHTYLTIEKILETHEELPLNWPIQGTTGYDFLNLVNGIFCQQENEQTLTDIYHRFIGASIDCDRLIDEKKRLIISKHLAGDIDNLAHFLKQISIRYRYASDFTLYGLKSALVEVMALFPVYRTYINNDDISSSDRNHITQVIQQAKENIPVFLNELSFIEKFLLLDFDDYLSGEEQQQWLLFVMRLQQFTGPLMAKGIEDTVLYIYNRLVSLNEVGSNPLYFGVSLDEFHQKNHLKCANWPHTMNATATHDTKRGEDVRSRINVLSEIPDQWDAQLRKWQALNAAQKHCLPETGLDVPDTNDEYFLYQTLIGTFPFTDTDHDDFVERIKEYTVKAIREAKVYTAWLKPDTGYEDGFTQFAERILKPSPKNEFLTEFRVFQRKIQHYGVFNSLSQVLLKMTAPGVPDIYQGTELWDLSLVDPDNRRPVDYKLRTKYLRAIKKAWDKDPLDLLKTLLEKPEDGRVKLFLIYQLLQARHQFMEVFQRGDYQKLTVIGSLQDHVVAFTRTWGSHTAIAIAPRFFTSIVSDTELPLGEQVWHETRLSLPPGSPSHWCDLISGQTLNSQDALFLRDTLAHFPVALLVNSVDDVNSETEVVSSRHGQPSS